VYFVLELLYMLCLDVWGGSYIHTHNNTHIMGDNIGIEEELRAVYVGVIISLVGNTCISIALSLQKYVHNKNFKKIPFTKIPLWW